MSKSKRKRRVRDKWRSKNWYTVYAPSYFGNRKITDTPVEDPKNLVGRVVETSLYELTGDLTKDYVSVQFQITGVDGQKAKTVFKGHHFTRDFIRAKIRRRRTLIEGFFSVKTKDGYDLMINVMVITRHKTTKIKENAIRRIIKEILEKRAKELDYGNFVNEIILEKLTADILPEVGKITPIGFIGVSKSKLLRVAG